MALRSNKAICQAFVAFVDLLATMGAGVKLGRVTWNLKMNSYEQQRIDPPQQYTGAIRSDAAGSGANRNSLASVMLTEQACFS